MSLTVGLFYNFKPDVVPKDVAPDFFAEFDSQKTVDSIAAALEAAGHKVVRFEAVPKTIFSRLDDIRELDLAFNIAEGVFGESRESHIPAILEMLRVPYTGSGIMSLALNLDKAMTKRVLDHHKIPTPRFWVFNSVSEIPKIERMPFPLIVKPIREGSSKGVHNESIVHDIRELKAQVERINTSYAQEAIVEEFLTGREFTIALLGNDPPTALPIVEILFDKMPKGAAPAYSYELKWIWDVPENPLKLFTCPARLSAALKKKLQDTAIAAFNATECRDWCRIDLRFDAANQTPHVLELNPLPGIIPDPNANSCFPEAARAAGMTYDEIVNAVVLIAMKRYGNKKFQEELGRPYYKKLSKKLGEVNAAKK